MRTIEYKREKAVAYAHTWANGRNPQYYSFDFMGGDCTNFASQAIYAGAGVMNYTRDVGWYYISLQNRSAAWTGVEHLHNFLVNNKGPGPFGKTVPMEKILPGDIIQLRFHGADAFSHSLIVVSTGAVPDPDNILIATHSYNADNRRLSSYSYEDARFIHIQGARTW